MSTPKARQDWIVGLLAKDPNSTYTDVYVKYHDLWGRKRSTFDKDWKNSQKEVLRYRLKAEKEKERIVINESTKAFKKGLKSKLERDLEIQQEIEHYKDILDGKVKVSFILGQRVEENKDLPIQVVVLIQNTISELRKDLGKRLGEYEPKKVEITTPKPILTKRIT